MRPRIEAEIERFSLAAPFRISGYTFESVDVLVVSVERDGCVGHGEAAGVYYKNDTPAAMLRQVEELRDTIHRGTNRESLQRLLPPGGARNALDCAWWDLDAKLTGRAAWQTAGLSKPQPLLTTFTCSADTPEKMAKTAIGFSDARAIKLKLIGELADADRVRAVREARPDVWLGVDANQGFTRTLLEELMPALLAARVELIEQPCRVGEEALLDGFRSPIPIAADESAQSGIDLLRLVDRFNVVNIKLDKCGGLTEGLAMARAAHELGLQTMVGNMISTSLAMAPAFLLGQLCKIVDLDGPVFLKRDRAIAVQYAEGFIACPGTLWG